MRRGFNVRTIPKRRKQPARHIMIADLCESGGPPPVDCRVAVTVDAQAFTDRYDALIGDL